MFREDVFFRAVASRKIPRVRIAAIVVDGDDVLVQRPVDDPAACYAFIGGEYEIGDSFESRLRAEFEEETNARLTDVRYLFCVEARFRHADVVVQQVEHYLLAKIDRRDVMSREPHLCQSWLPRSRLGDFDLRPYVVRDAVRDGSFLTVRHLTSFEA